MKSGKKPSTNGLKRKIATNVALSILVLSVGALCLSPLEEDVSASTEKGEIYRSAGENGVGVSLMFNVYDGKEYVYRILDTLDTYGAKVTFFIGGCWADDNVQCLRDIYAAGHEIGNHGYFHKDHKSLPLAQNEKEISSCNRFIELALGTVPTLFAPPSGSYGTEMLSACKTLQMQTILWSKDTIDWRDQDEGLIYNRATSEVVKGDFVLMHPTNATANALEDILKYYKKNSLQVVTISQNLQSEG